MGTPRPPSYARTNSSSSVNGAVKKSKKDFEIGEVIGEGSYSEVYEVKDLTPPHRMYALKVLNKRHITREKKIQYVHVEKNALTRLHKHPGVVRLFWTFHDVDSLYFVLELASNGEILHHLRSHGSFSLPTSQYYAAQIVDALSWIHDHGVIHRDLKPENILLDAEWRIKITDFGTAKVLTDGAGGTPGSRGSGSTGGKGEEEEERANSFVGTAEYVSPELLTSKTAYKSSDCWALGCIIYQFLAGRPPFKAASEYLTFQKIIACDYTFPTEFPSVPRDLVEKLLVLDYKKRLNVREVKEHEFFDGFDWETLWTRE
ncbi:kinase-like protein, partial [Atractiella rhizophila]